MTSDDDEDDVIPETPETQAQPISSHYDEDIAKEFEDDSDDEKDDWKAFGRRICLDSKAALSPPIDDRKTTSSSSTITKKRKQILISDSSDDEDPILTPAPKKRALSPPQLRRSLSISSSFSRSIFTSPVPFQSPVLSTRRVKKMIVTTEYAEDGSVISENTKKTYYN